MTMKIEIDSSDLLKIREALQRAYIFFQFRDKMNAEVHLAQNVHFSPITSLVGTEHTRCVNILERSEEEYV